MLAFLAPANWSTSVENAASRYFFARGVHVVMTLTARGIAVLSEKYA